MKKILLLLMLIAIGFSTQLLAQAPLRINYQGVARNNFGTTVNNKTISLRLSVREGTSGGVIVYSETHIINTD
jgi:trimeric autotransporter adhesin